MHILVSVWAQRLSELAGGELFAAETFGLGHCRTRASATLRSNKEVPEEALATMMPKVNSTEAGCRRWRRNR